MKETLRNNCDLFAENYYALKKNYRWSNSINTRLGALLYVLENRNLDIEAINKCRKIINDNTGALSQFRDITNIIVSVILSLQKEPEAYFKRIISVYDAMKKEGFHSSPYLILAATSVVSQAEKEQYQWIITSARSYYNAMKAEHRFITSSDDYCYSALLAISGKPVSEDILEMEKCYQRLQQSFTHSNAMQSLSHILTLSSKNIDTKCKQVEDMYHALRKYKCKFGLGIELSFLGVVVLLEEDTEKLAAEIAEINEYLSSKKGFGSWSLVDKERIMYSIALACSAYLDDSKKNTLEMILTNNITGILRAQQVTTVTAAT
jgi:hypothetical protein